MQATKSKNKITANSAPKREDKFMSKILENLDKVNANDWELYANLDSIYPSNLFTKKRYKGINILSLFLDTMINKFTSSKYASFNAISKAGGRLKKGAKGCIIEFFSFIYKDKRNGKILTIETIKTLSPAELENIEKIACLRNYIVFNSEFIENLDEINLDITIEEQEENEILEIENCENFIFNIISNGGLKLRFALEDIAFYSPSFDYIQLPERNYFLSTAKYYSTLFHEVIHWTGNEKRLDRDLNGHKSKESYSFEELIAEMGSMLICLQFGLSDEFINSVRYLKGWVTINRQDRETALRGAFIQSKKAKKYLESFQ
ncbi:hypothetical protein CMT22_17880 [Elizabethkingia anophelis]|nr:hypothetical protein [Elizabethkingia anophelis]